MNKHFFSPSLIFLSGAFLFSCVNCSPSYSSSPQTWQTICAREEEKNQKRLPLYRAVIPIGWKRQNPSPEESLLDTTKAICEFYIYDGTEQVRITLHTFPVNEQQMRIPPQAQIERWKKQFEDLDPLSVQIVSQSHGGFIGLYLEAAGIYQEKLQKMLAWSMQLAPDYDRQLANQKERLNSRLMRADYTIKATGPLDLIHKHRKAIMLFANSFELIEELPQL